MLNHQAMKLVPFSIRFSSRLALILAGWRLTALAVEAPVTPLDAGDLGLNLRCASNGIVLERLFDAGASRDLSAPTSLPLFTISLRPAGATGEVAVVADKGWRRCALTRRARGLDLVWTDPLDASLAGISVKATASADRHASAIRWRLRVQNTSTNWSVWRVVFPAGRPGRLRDQWRAAASPRARGRSQRGVWDRPFSFRGDYPNGWCSMQFMAAYREGAEQPAGLYVGRARSVGQHQGSLAPKATRPRAPCA